MIRGQMLRRRICHVIGNRSLTTLTLSCRCSRVACLANPDSVSLYVRRNRPSLPVSPKSAQECSLLKADIATGRIETKGGEQRLLRGPIHTFDMMKTIGRHTPAPIAQPARMGNTQTRILSHARLMLGATSK